MLCFLASDYAVMIGTVQTRLNVPLMFLFWRYLKALHCDVKKGRWSLEEEEQLIDLVQKHGLGKCGCGLTFKSLEKQALFSNLPFKFLFLF